MMTTDEPLPRALEILWREPQRGPALPRAEPRAHRHGSHRVGRRRRSRRVVDGTAGRAAGLRHDVALPPRRQQGRVGDVHVVDRARAAAHAERSRGLAWRALRIGPTGCGTSTTATRGSCRPRRPVRRPIPVSSRGWMPGLAALGGTGLTERDKLAAVMAVLHFVRGAAALDIEAAQVDGPDYPVLLRRFVGRRPVPGAGGGRSRPGCSTPPTTITSPTSARDCGSCSTGSPPRSRVKSCSPICSDMPPRLRDGPVGGSMPRVATSKPQTISYPAPGSRPSRHDDYRGRPHTWSCCSVRRVTWHDGS